jgi:flagellar L-ring protein precursor FlgH
MSPRFALVLLTVALTGCGSLSKLSEVGRPPEMTPTADPTKDPSWRPVSMPMPHAQAAPAEANSLWRSGSRAFFKDQRAANVGDIITIVVSVADAAQVKNASTSQYTGTQSLGVPNFFGLETRTPPYGLPGANPSSLLSTNGASNAAGTGQIQRNETVAVRLAGVITQVLPNGNLVVSARQQMLVNSELRELQVTGVIRPEDIASDNTVMHDRMAEARITYGGRGQLTNVQTARWGQQILDILLPF